MRIMAIVKAAGNHGCGVEPDRQYHDEMRKFNEALAQAGVMIAVDRLRPGSEGTRVRISGTDRTVIDGPFAETKEFVGGFWMWQVRSKAEAIAWARRCPAPPGGEVEIELREVLDPDGFGPAITREAMERARHEPALAGGRK